jgi:hypothetical protein
METFDLPPERVMEAMNIKAAHPKLSANDCFCLVTTRCHEGAILLTGDANLRRIASNDGQRVHGVIWIVDELRRLNLCSDEILLTALEIWRDDAAVFLPNNEIDRRLRVIRRLN